MSKIFFFIHELIFFIIFASLEEQEKEEDWLHPIQRLCSDMAAERKSGYESFFTD